MLTTSIIIKVGPSLIASAIKVALNLMNGLYDEDEREIDDVDPEDDVQYENVDRYARFEELKKKYEAIVEGEEDDDELDEEDDDDDDVGYDEITSFDDLYRRNLEAAKRAEENAAETSPSSDIFDPNYEGSEPDGELSLDDDEDDEEHVDNKVESLGDYLNNMSDTELKDYVIKSVHKKGIEKGIAYLDANTLKKYGPSFICAIMEAIREEEIDYSCLDNEDELMEAIADAFFEMMNNKDEYSPLLDKYPSHLKETNSESTEKNADDDSDDDDDEDEDDDDDDDEEDLAEILSDKPEDELRSITMNAIESKLKLDPGMMRHYGNSFISAIIEMLQCELFYFIDEEDMNESLLSAFVILVSHFEKESTIIQDCLKVLQECKGQIAKKMEEAHAEKDKKGSQDDAFRELIMKNVSEDTDGKSEEEEEDDEDAVSDFNDGFGTWVEKDIGSSPHPEPKRVELKTPKNESVNSTDHSNSTRELNVPVENLMEYQPDKSLPMYSKPKMSSTRARHVKKTISEYSAEFICGHEFERMMRDLFVFGPFSKKENEKGETPIYYIYQKGIDNIIFADTYGGYVDDLITDLVDAYNVYQMNEAKIENGGMSESQVESLRKSSAIKIEKIFAEISTRTGGGGVIFEQNDDD